MDLDGQILLSVSEIIFAWINMDSIHICPARRICPEQYQMIYTRPFVAKKLTAAVSSFSLFQN